MTQTNESLYSQIKKRVAERQTDSRYKEQRSLLKMVGELLTVPNDTSNALKFRRGFLERHYSNNKGSYFHQLNRTLLGVAHLDMWEYGIDGLYVAPVISSFSIDNQTRDNLAYVVTNLRPKPSIVKRYREGLMDEPEKYENICMIATRFFMTELSKKRKIEEMSHSIKSKEPYTYITIQDCKDAVLPILFKAFGMNIGHEDPNIYRLTYNLDQQILGAAQLAAMGVGINWHTENFNIPAIRFIP